MGKSKDLATGAAYQDQTESDTRYVNVTGDTMTSGLTINTASNGVPSINLQHSNSGADNFQIVAGTPGVANSGFSIRDTDASANRLVINSSGHVTMPNQPCFSAGGDFGWQDVGFSYAKPTPWRTNQTGQFNSGMWNNSTGRATAPVAGRYQFNLNIYTNNSGESYHYGRLYLNGTAFAGTILHLGDTGGGYPDETMGASFIINMAANDYVEYYHSEDIYGYHSSFSGFMIG